MGKKKEKIIDLNNLKPEETMKYEIAKELGYLDKVMSTGWNSLTAKESGRIGGILAKRKRRFSEGKQLNKEVLEEKLIQENVIQENVIQENVIQDDVVGEND